MRQRLLLVLVGALMFFGGYSVGSHRSKTVYAQSATPIPKSFGHLVSVYTSPTGDVGLAFENSDGVIHFTTGTGANPVELPRR